MAEQHKHLIARGEISTPIMNVSDAKAALLELVDLIGMKLLDGYGQSPEEYQNPLASYCPIEGNRGLTAIALIETSNITLHLWDESNPGVMQLDLYSCRDFDLSIVMDWTRRWMGVQTMRYWLIDRASSLTFLDHGIVTDSGDVITSLSDQTGAADDCADSASI